MKSIRNILALTTTAAVVAFPGFASAQSAESGFGHAVFVMTNDADSNHVLAYPRAEDGTLLSAHTFKTGGRGSGGTVDPLSSQGSLTLSTNGAWLFAVNAGSGTLSVFRVAGSSLDLSDQVPTGGSEPNAVAEHGGLVYVLNTAGTSGVSGFWLRDGKLSPIAGSRKFLSGNNIGSSSLAFSPDGKFLTVIERTTNFIDVFSVQPDGTLSAIKENPSAGPGAFGLLFAPNDTAIVSETGSSAPNSSAISSYKVNSDHTLTVVSASVPTLGAANCWNTVTPDGQFVYASNSASSSIAGFRIGASGALAPLPGTVVGLNPSGSTNLDLAITADGRFLYSINAAGGSIGAFAIDRTTGTLTNLGAIGGLPASVGFNGIAAN